MNSLAIIICTWNRADSLRATLRSLERQEVLHGSVSIEVIVVDNNSTDLTSALVEGMMASWTLGELRYCSEPRQGKQFALNTGIRASHSDLLAFTDDDIVFPTNWVASICAAFQDPALEVAGGKTLLIWPDEGAPPWYAANMAAVLGGVDIGEERILPPPQGYAPAGANLVARRALFARVGLFSEAHFRHMDYEFGLRCAQHGTVLAYDPALVVCAPVDAPLLSKRYFRRWSFKAGISHDDAANSKIARLPQVPAWVYRQLVQDILRLPIDLLVSTPALAFTRELRIWRSVGTIASCWYAWLSPERYPQWVARYSQKKKNLY